MKLVGMGVLVLAGMAVGCVTPKRQATPAPTSLPPRESPEVAELRRIVGNGSTLNLSFEPQTPEGKGIKAAFEEAAKIDRDFEKARRSLTFDVILSPQRLGTDEGIRQSQAELTRLRKLFGDYYGQSLVVADRIQALVASIGNTSAPPPATLRDHRQEAFKVVGSLFDAAQAIVAFAEKNKPVAEATGKNLFFSSQKQMADFDGLVATFQKAAQAEQRALVRILNMRQASLDQSLALLRRQS